MKVVSIVVVALILSGFDCRVGWAQCASNSYLINVVGTGSISASTAQPAANQRVYVDQYEVFSNTTPPDMLVSATLGSFESNGITVDLGLPFATQSGSFGLQVQTFSPLARGPLGAKVTLTVSGIPVFGATFSAIVLGCIA